MSVLINLLIIDVRKNVFNEKYGNLISLKLRIRRTVEFVRDQIIIMILGTCLIIFLLIE